MDNSCSSSGIAYTARGKVTRIIKFAQAVSTPGWERGAGAAPVLLWPLSVSIRPFLLLTFADEDTSHSKGRSEEEEGGRGEEGKWGRLMENEVQEQRNI